ncbi:MAG TPA: arsenic metallochaperone ArsD family protein, partial [Gemmatimonadaceae bacterium]|nr:arsenic metallochaperone ArsD family protein [Gemmatimonadaceae bacterium]
MSRSLPLAGPSDPATATEPSPGAGVPLTRAAAPSPDPVALHGTVAVFDPAMCCPTGVCGAGVDPALLQIARDLRWLTARGVQVRRAGLSQEPQA